ncbi:MAG: Zn-dependent exopeptidase M28 [Clostridia bacterium]|nr:Zn-dependent exopeptidase M28 [Clostridia bacterium]
MNTKTIRQVLKDTDFIHVGGTEEELKVAQYLMQKAIAYGAAAHIEPFPVQMADVHSASLTVDGRSIPCKGYRCCGSGEIEAPFIYVPDETDLSLSKVNGKIVLLDTILRYFGYNDMLDHGAKGFITYDGNVNYRDNDIDDRELRSFVANGRKALAVNINAKDAAKLVRSRPKSARITVDETEYEGESRNVVAELPGTSDEWIVMTAHYDTVPLSRGSYDNMSGCITLLHAIEALAPSAPHRYGLRFVFCGSEERGLLGSKAYVSAHEEELGKIALNINVDMIGSVMGKFISVVSAEEALVSHVKYLSTEMDWSVEARSGVYSSDSTPFADKGVPALSFARIAPPAQASIHNRYDTMALLSEEQIREDSDFITAFARRMADAPLCPVKREIPQKIKDELDQYLNRKRREQKS